MKILFSSDLHGMESAYRRFSHHLKDYDFGVLSGDMQEDFLPDGEVIRLTGQSYLEKSSAGSPDADAVLMKALELRALELAAILDESQKPIFFVLGNHDIVPWPDIKFIQNIHMKRVDLGEYNLVGYRWTRIERPTESINSDIKQLTSQIDKNTILVTHSPPFGFLDGEERYGLRALRRLPTPWLHLFGHVHNSYGQMAHRINGAWPDLRKFFEIDVENRSYKLIDSLHISD